jgi:hypothetical protein
VWTADFNHDGNQDLVVGNFGSNSASILLGTGTGSFGTATNYTVGTGPQGVDVGDFNRDGNADFATSNFTSNDVTIRLGTGTGSFGAAFTFCLNGGTRPFRISVGDFNNDRNPDLAAADSGTGNLSILLGTGNACTGANCFGTATNFPAGGTSPRRARVGEFNGDGNQDLAVANFGSNTVTVLLGTGTGSFGSPTSYAVGNQPSTPAIADVDLDGIQDLLVAAGGSGPSGNEVSVLLGTGTGTFTAATNFTMGNGSQAVTIGDFNKDDWPDIATSNSGSRSVSVRLNTTQSVVLSINIPGPADLGSGTTAGHFSAQLGTITVTDNRAGAHTWTMTVTATAFTTGAGGPTETIGNDRLSYWSGPAITTTGDGTFVPGQLTAGQAVPLSTARTAFSHPTGTVPNSASWNPTIIVDPPPTGIAGTYSGTIVHSVS